MKLREAQTISVRFKPPKGMAPADALVNFAIGLLPEIELEHGEVVESRFGIPSPAPSHTFPKGSRLGIANRKPVGNGKVVVRSTAGDHPLVLPADVFLPSAVSRVVPKDHLKIRFALRFADVCWTPWGSRQYNFKLQLPPIDAAHPLVDFLDVALLLKMLDGAARSGRPLDLTLYLGEHRVVGGTLTDLGRFTSPIREWADVVISAGTVAEHFGVLHKLSTTVEEIFQQRWRLQVLETVLAGRNFRITTTIDRLPENPDELFSKVVDWS